MNSVITFLIVLLLFNQLRSSVRNQRDYLLFYESKKYSIPKRQVIISINPPLKYPPEFENNKNKNTTISFNNGNKNNNKPDIIFRDYDDNDDDNQSKQIILSEGSFCRRSFDGISGYCIVAYQCLHIIREYRKHGTKIDICSYQKNIPVICCPLEKKNSDNFNERISAKKCAEYYTAKFQINPKEHNAQDEKCEISVPLIVGGDKTYPGEYPHMAAIGWTKVNGDINWACGGTLISKQYILTAAHCTKLGGKQPNLVRLGDQNLYSASDKAEPIDIKIINITIHPKYKDSFYYHDIALLKIEKPVDFTKFIYPACLWDKELNKNEIKIVTATGWGRIKFLGAKSEELLKVNLEIIDNDKCNNLYNKETKLPNGITDNQFCAGYLEGGKDTCQGDSGGPINLKIPKYNCINYIVGVTSFGKHCAAPNAPGVYIKISAYLDWIEKIIFK